MSTESQQADQDGLKRLKLIRGGNRGKVTKLQREANELLRNYESPVEKEEIIRKLTIIAKTLKDKQSYISKLDEDILQKCPPEEIETEIDETTDIARKIDDVLEEIRDKIKFYEAKAASTNLVTSTPSADRSSVRIRTTEAREINNAEAGLNSSASSANSSNRSLIHGVKLPKINLPRFNGDVTKFQPFWQSFKCSVDESENLSAVHKLNYLVNSLEGPAFKAVEGLEIIEANYEKAVEILKTRFGNSQQIISTHMQQLLNLQSHPNDRVNHLRSIYDNIMIHIRGLESLGIASEKYGSLLIPLIISRMPGEIALQVARKTSEDIWQINEIMDIIRKEIEAREISERIQAADRKKPEKFIKPQASSPVGTTKSFVTQDEKKKGPLRCYFCKKEHVANKCEEVTDIKTRIQIINAAKRCQNCLKIGHVIKDCFSKGRCRNCNGKHNTLLCLKTGEQSMPVNNVNQANTMDSSVTTSTLKQKTNVLLQTAKTYAFGSDRSEKIPVNLLFDCGSQKSYIKEELKSKLSLQVQQKETLNLNTFGTEKYSKKVSERVIVNLEVNDEVIPISALTSPAICLPVSSRVDIGNYPHLSGLQLANKVDSRDQAISILIGADQYHNIVIGQVIKGSSGPVAISSKLGWLLSGPVVSHENDTISSSNIVSNLVLDIVPSREEVINESKEITDSLQTFWKHESLGLTGEAEASAVNEQGRKQTVIEFKEKEKRYEVSLPYKEEKFEPLSSDLQMCTNRLNSLYRRLRKDSNLLEQYDQIFKDRLANGVIERVPQENENNVAAHFLCHFGVIRNERETTKLRVVFDGSAKSEPSSVSLSDRLEIGDNNMPLLFDTLLRFRTHRLAITTDIEKAFLQIGINESHRYVLRFLWFDDVSKENPSIIQYRYCRLYFGLTCSPSILSETIRKHVSQYKAENPHVVSILYRLYADDMSCGTDTVEDALNIYKTSKEILSRGF